MAKIKNHKNRKKQSVLRIILILLIIIFLAIAITQVLYYFKYIHSIEQIKVYDMNLSVGDYIGFNVGNESLNFGTVTPGGGVSRNISISTNKTVKVEIILKGELAPFVKISENNFIFTGNKNLSFDVSVSEDIEKGNYGGRVIILFKRINK